MSNKIIFFGSASIAVESVKALIDRGYEICCVVTQPDRKKGRHLHVSMTPVKEFALCKKLHIVQPTNLTSQKAHEDLQTFDPDFFVVMAYGKILPQNILDIPKRYPLNIHASLLPKYRGAAPINWALINGEEKTGITIMRMVNKMDAGDVLLKKEISILDSDTAATLEEKLCKLGAEAIQEALASIASNSYTFNPQDETHASYAPKLKRQDGHINWQSPAHSILNRIRGCAGWPGTFTLYKQKIVKIWSAEATHVLVEKNQLPGSIIAIESDGITVAANDYGIRITELQLSSGKRLPAKEFLRGHALAMDEQFV